MGFLLISVALAGDTTIHIPPIEEPVPVKVPKPSIEYVLPRTTAGPGWAGAYACLEPSGVSWLLTVDAIRTDEWLDGKLVLTGPDVAEKVAVRAYQDPDNFHLKVVAVSVDGGKGPILGERDLGATLFTLMNDGITLQTQPGLVRTLSCKQA